MARLGCPHLAMVKACLLLAGPDLPGHTLQGAVGPLTTERQASWRWFCEPPQTTGLGRSAVAGSWAFLSPLPISPAKCVVL